ncbi:MAG: hypothetical protein JWQ09_329 [Segetibacter sp.]|nr:hypothetical protein [Segetibacter sp.]
MELTKDEIEQINSFGPFNHSVWKKDSIVVTQEEVLAGRADFLVSKIREIILTNYSSDDIKKMSIVDIGCYDGYILQQLTDLPFKKMVGVEPRQINIDKGKSIRKILGIKEKIIFKRNTLEELDKQKFDIVICVGVLHHVESISTAIRKLDSICRRMMILENLCIPSEHITDSFKVDIEMKDVIYKTENLCGITGQKFESSYYDGSAASTTVVSIPTIETMMMHLSSLGHTNFSVAATPDDFFRAMKKNTRPSKEVLIYSLKSQKKNIIDKSIFDYESGLINTYLNEELIYPLYQKYVQKKKNVNIQGKIKKVVDYIDGKKNITDVENKGNGRYSDEIVRNMRFNTVDKIAFEYAKMKYQNGEHAESIRALSNIVQKLNSDWRTCYRSFYLMAKIYSDTKKTGLARRYLKLCQSCNPEYPLLKKTK